MRKCLLAMLILMLVILMLILMLLNLNTGYADTDLCIRIMSFCCNTIHSYDTSIIHEFLTNRIADEESPQILSHTLRLATIVAL